jgi:hypothetical protein
MEHKQSCLHVFFSKGVTLVSLGARYIAMILQWNGECVAVAVIARMEFMTRVQAWLSFEWNCLGERIHLHI